LRDGPAPPTRQSTGYGLYPNPTFAENRRPSAAWWTRPDVHQQPAFRPFSARASPWENSHFFQRVLREARSHRPPRENFGEPRLVEDCAGRSRLPLAVHSDQNWRLRRKNQALIRYVRQRRGLRYVAVGRAFAPTGEPMPPRRQLPLRSNAPTTMNAVPFGAPARPAFPTGGKPPASSERVSKVFPRRKRRKSPAPASAEMHELAAKRRRRVGQQEWPQAERDADSGIRRHQHEPSVFGRARKTITISSNVFFGRGPNVNIRSS